MPAGKLSATEAIRQIAQQSLTLSYGSGYCDHQILLDSTYWMQQRATKQTSFFPMPIGIGTKLLCLLMMSTAELFGSSQQMLLLPC